MDYFTLKIGDIVESTQGRDLGTRYLVVGIDEKKGYCSLINGKLKPIENPKIKNSKHLIYIGSAPELIKRLSKNITNCELSKLIEKFNTNKE